MNDRNCLRWSALLGLSGIAIGALGAHALKDLLESNQLNSLETAVRYQLFHTMALLVLALSNKALEFKWSARFWLWGTLFFSGSIYMLIGFSQMGWPKAFLGPITPLGGLLLMAGWLALFFGGKPKDRA